MSRPRLTGSYARMLAAIIGSSRLSERERERIAVLRFRRLALILTQPEKDELADLEHRDTSE